MLRILLFLKKPQAGLVKTRLAHSIGPDAALRTYRQLVRTQLEHLPGGAKLEVHYTPAEAEADMRAWLGEDRIYRPQAEGGLGNKLECAVKDAFQRGAKQVVCIGGDCPYLHTTHFEHTAQALADGADVVFGPSMDGGYYLVGLQQARPELFRNIPWSSSGTLAASLERAADLGLRTVQLERLEDVDDQDSLERAVRNGALSPP
ncbi:MAG: TIGR04282 family arsenosugar biosynthesis glycosyltransferase [Opitutales bacterium]